MLERPDVAAQGPNWRAADILVEESRESSWKMVQRHDGRLCCSYHRHCHTLAVSGLAVGWVLRARLASVYGKRVSALSLILCLTISVGWGSWGDARINSDS